MSVASAVASGRRAAEARMTSRATIHRKTGNLVQDEATGLEVPEWDSVYVDRPFRLGVSRGFTPPSKRIAPGGVEVQIALRVGHFPAGTDLADSDLVEVTSGENIGTVWRVVEGDSADQLTARRIPLTSETRPEEWP